MRVTTLLLIVLATAPPASGGVDRPLVDGDVVISGSFASFSDTGIRVFDAQGAERGRLDGGRGEVRFAPDGTLAVLARHEVRFLRPDGTVARTLAYSRPGTPPMEWPHRIAFRRDGGFFITSGFQILRFSASGEPDPYTFYNDGLPVGLPSIFGLDVAPDQCTLFASEVHITASNLCAKTRATILSPRGMAVRLLPDGTFVTSWGLGSTVRRYSSNGWLVRAYTPAGRLLAVDRNPRFVWVETVAGTAQRLDLDADALVGAPIVTGFTEINGLAPVGEWRASVEGVQTIPTLSEWMLMALAVVLCALALRRLS